MVTEILARLRRAWRSRFAAKAKETIAGDGRRDARARFWAELREGQREAEVAATKR
jgi:hypothetical protein